MVDIYLGACGDDIAEHRRKALDALRDMNGGCRVLSADTGADAGECDLYVGMFGPLPGPRDARGKPLAHTEYEAAVKGGRPSLLLFADTHLPIPNGLLVAEAEHLKPQDEFCKEAARAAQGTGRTVASFDSADSAATRIHQLVPGLRGQMEELLENRLLDLLRPFDIASDSDTAGFKTLGGRTMLDRLQARLHQALHPLAEVRTKESFKDAGCDIRVDFRRGPSFGLQVKSHGDVASKDFTADLKRQVAESLALDLRRLFVLVGADLTDDGQYRKANNLENEPGIGRARNVTLIPPKWLWPLVRDHAAPKAAAKAAEEPPPLPIPASPAPYFAHPYRLQMNFTGRAAERRRLSRWYRDDKGRPLLMLEAIGGQGKSALAWTWVMGEVLGLPVAGLVETEDVGDARLDPDHRPEAVVWWSFYEEGADFSAFLAHTLGYLEKGQAEGRPEDEPDASRLDRLSALLRRRRVLLVLDGLERELRAYGRGEAVHEDDPDIRDARDRAALDPQMESFLGVLCRPDLAARVLITTRLPPQCLDRMAEVENWTLNGLSVPDARAFLAAEGIACDAATAQRIAEDCGNHSLTLSVLAGWIKSRPGADLSTPDWGKITRELKGFNHNHVFQAALDSLSPRDREVARRLSILRGLVSFATAQALNSPMDATNVHQSLGHLAAARLIALRPEGIDMHPAIRRWLYGQLGDDKRKGLHSQAALCFAALPPPDTPKIWQDLEPVMELCRHLAAAGDLDGAWRVYREKLKKDLIFRFCRHEEARQLLLPIFPGGVEAPPSLSIPESKADALFFLGIFASYGGSPRQSLGFRRRALTSLPGRLSFEGDCRNNMALAHWQLGELQAAEYQANQSLKIRVAAPPFWRALALERLALIHYLRGACEEAKSLTARLETLWPLAIPDFPTPLSSDHLRARHAMSHCRWPEAIIAACRRLDDARRAGNEVEIISALILRAAIGQRLGQGDDEGKHAAAEALRRARDCRLIPHECEVLPLWAWHHRHEVGLPRAITTAMDGLALSTTCEYRLKQADAHLVLAQLHLEAGDRDKAVEHAHAARERARCDGPPDYTYRQTWDAAGELLTRLGETPAE